ncbi:uncharacterized protein LOC121972224 [Zingiber officinale]|uniref:uncharacterized protein LOC121972224 n=1 Tax=Zingiber officinale TaxID=94328 RepID=UPI001C4D9607|nr:uncharacterized protein LOC121972224 [Zingiber officinale]
MTKLKYRIKPESEEEEPVSDDDDDEIKTELVNLVKKLYRKKKGFNKKDIRKVIQSKEAQPSSKVKFEFGVLRRLISDNGRQFVRQRLREWCEGYGIQQAFTSVAYPHSNGQAEVVNREILRILRARLDHVGGSWADEQSGMLWDIRTTPKEGTGVTPFHLVYGGEAVVPVEVGVESDRVQQYNEDNAE